MAYLLVDEEFPYISALISRELKNLAQLLVRHHCPVALEGLLQSAQNLVKVEVIREALHSGETLPPTSLLHADVYFPHIFILRLIIKGIYFTTIKVK